MTARFVLTPRAQADLDAIWDYTEARWGIAQAENYLRQLGRDLQRVAEHPTIGTDCADIRPGYCEHPSGAHVLFCRLTADGIDVVRIFHERMDPDRHIP
ncbi:MAG: type II toxin-antitoxin system RelE/ParE family toxin [Steroidobacteraceae bacterium]